jgi:hypothetical protein
MDIGRVLQQRLSPTCSPMGFRMHHRLSSRTIHLGLFSICLKTKFVGLQELDELIRRQKKCKIQREQSIWAKSEACRRRNAAIVALGDAVRFMEVRAAQERCEMEKKKLWLAIEHNEKLAYVVVDIISSSASVSLTSPPN